MNIPNKLTLLRLFLTPFILIFIYFEKFRMFALILFSIAVISDYLDGWFAVHKNMKSKFGNFIDPVTDKILIITCLILLSFLGLFPLWIILIIMSREFIMNGLRSVLSEGENIVGANIGGKTKFSLQSFLIFLSIIYLLFPKIYPHEFVVLLNVLLLVVVVISLISLFNFIHKNLKNIKGLLRR